MKSKLLLLLLVSVVLVLMFALSVSAEVAIYDDAPTKMNITVRTDDVVVFKDGFSCLSSYISSDVTSTSNGWNGALTVKELFDFSYINGKTGKNYGFSDIVSVDIPQGVTYIGGYGITGATNLQRISFPDTVTGFGGWLLMGCTALENCIFEHDEDDGLTNIGPEFFAGCSNLTAISLPDCITSFGWNVNYDGGYFKNCTSLSVIHLPNKLEIMYGGTDAMSVFGDLTNVYFVNEAFTYDNVPAKPDVYYFPSGLAKMTGTPFRNCKNLNKVLVFGHGTTSITRGWEFENTETGDGAKPTVVFLGDTESINVNGWNVAAVYFANENDVNGSTAGVSGGATIYYCNADGNTNHLTETSVDMMAGCEVNAAKVISCFCGFETRQEVAGTALSHNYDYLKGDATLVSFTYTSYFENGTKIVACANCRENCEFVTPILFVWKGYSASTYGDTYSVVQGFYIDRDALSQYMVYAPDFDFGIIATGNANGGAIKPQIGADKVFIAVFDNSVTSYFDVKVTGITEERRNSNIVFCIYVLDGGKMYYLDNEKTGEDVVGISYNEILG